MLRAPLGLDRYLWVIKILLFVNLIFSIVTLGIKEGVFAAEYRISLASNSYNELVTAAMKEVFGRLVGDVKPITWTRWWAMFVVSIPYLDAMTTYAKDLWGRGVRFALVPLGIVVSFSILASGYWTSLLFTSRFGHPFVDEVFGSIFGLLAYWFILSAIGTARIFGQDAMSMYIAKTANVPLAVAVVYLSVSLGLFGLSFARF